MYHIIIGSFIIAILAHKLTILETTVAHVIQLGVMIVILYTVQTLKLLKKTSNKKKIRLIKKTLICKILLMISTVYPFYRILLIFNNMTIRSGFIIIYILGVYGVMNLLGLGGLKFEIKKTESNNVNLFLKAIKKMESTLNKQQIAMKSEINKIICTSPLVVTSMTKRSLTNDEKWIYYQTTEEKIKNTYPINSLYDLTDWLEQRRNELKLYKNTQIELSKEVSQSLSRYTKLQTSFRKSYSWSSNNIKLLDNQSKYIKKGIDEEIIKSLDFMYDEAWNLVRTVQHDIQGFLRDFNTTRTGVKGEKTVNRILKGYPDFISLSNILLPEYDPTVDRNVTFENDNIVFTRRGIFLIEVKNYAETGNYSIIIERDGRWLKSQNNQLTEFKSAANQNDRQVRLFKSFINKRLGRDFDNPLPIYGIVVIANTGVTIQNSCSFQHVIRAEEIAACIENEFDMPEKPLTKKEIDQMIAIVEDANLPPLSWEFEDYGEALTKNMYALTEQIQHIKKIIQVLQVQIKEQKISTTKALNKCLDEISEFFKISI